MKVDHFSRQKGRTEKYYFFDQLGGVFCSGESCFSAKTSDHWDNLGTEIDLVISKLSKLKTKTEELNFTAIGLLSNKESGLKLKLSMVTSLSCDNCEFTNRQTRELQSQTDEAKGNVNDTRRKLLTIFGGLQST